MCVSLNVSVSFCLLLLLFDRFVDALFFVAFSYDLTSLEGWGLLRRCRHCRGPGSWRASWESLKSPMDSLGEEGGDEKVPEASKDVLALFPKKT